MGHTAATKLAPRPRSQTGCASQRRRSPCTWTGLSWASQGCSRTLSRSRDTHGTRALCSALGCCGSSSWWSCATEGCPGASRRALSLSKCVFMQQACAQQEMQQSRKSPVAHHAHTSPATVKDAVACMRSSCSCRR